MRKSALSQMMAVSTLLISLLATIASLAGLFASSPYALETENWKLQAQAQDIGNLIGVLVLIVSAVMARKGSFRAYLVWLGMLFYFLYAYIIYAVAVHFNSLFLVYVAVLGLTLFTIIAALSRGLVNLSVPDLSARRFAGYTLIGVGVLFGLLWLSELVPALISGKVPQSLQDAGLWVDPVHVLDLSTVLPGFIATGYLAIKKRGTGLYFTAPWLAFSALMGASIVAAMILMSARGLVDTQAPLIMVSTVVLLSLAALVVFLRKVQLPSNPDSDLS
jgi:hypothetical protein